MTSATSRSLIEEASIGITECLNHDFRFNGVIKHCHEDFHVHEVSLDGRIISLNELLNLDAIRENLERKKNYETGKGVLHTDYTISPSVTQHLLNDHFFSQEDIETLETFIQKTVSYAQELSGDLGEEMNRDLISSQKGCLAISHEKKSIEPPLYLSAETETSPHSESPQLHSKSCSSKDDTADTDNKKNNCPTSATEKKPLCWPPHCYLFGKTSDQGSRAKHLISPPKSPSETKEDAKTIRRKMHQAISTYFPFLSSETVQLNPRSLMENTHHFENVQRNSYIDQNIKSTLAETLAENPTISSLYIAFKPSALSNLFSSKTRKRLKSYQQTPEETQQLTAPLEHSEYNHSHSSQLKRLPDEEENTSVETRKKKKQKRRRCGYQEKSNAEASLLEKTISIPHRNQPRWPSDRPPYLFFHLYKTNRDTAEAIQMIANCIHCSPKLFTYAGTKDRRAVTVQAITAYHLTIEQLHNALLHPRWDSNVKVSNLHYTDVKLCLGYLRGNHFRICIRNVPPDSQSCVNQAIQHLKENGFINYFGPQRFGTRAIKTHHVGIALLQGNFEKTVNLILGVSSQDESNNIDDLKVDKDTDPVSMHCLADENDFDFPTFTDKNLTELFNNQEGMLKDTQQDKDRPVGLNNPSVNFLPHAHKKPPEWKVAYCSGNIELALKLIAKHMYLERIILKSLRYSPNDYLKALQALPRNVLTLYIHAVQSLIWNYAASYRTKKYGLLPRVGDFICSVQLNSHQHSPVHHISQSSPATQDHEDRKSIEPSIVDYPAETNPQPLQGDAKACLSASETIGTHLTSPAFSCLSKNSLSQSEFVILKEENVNSADPFQILLPLPGEGVIYPDYLEEIYETICQEVLGIKLTDIRTLKSKGVGEYFGGYRVLRVCPYDIQHRFIEKAENHHILPTDEMYLSNSSLGLKTLDLMKLEMIPREATDNTLECSYENYGVVLFSCILPKASYLTMACRELLSC